MFEVFSSQRSCSLSRQAVCAWPAGRNNLQFEGFVSLTFVANGFYVTFICLVCALRWLENCVFDVTNVKR